MSTSHRKSPIPAIIFRYHKSLERYARRLTHHKDRTPDIVQWVFESMYDKRLLKDGPQLRRNLIEHTKTMAQRLGRLIEIHDQLERQGAFNSSDNADKEKKTTGL